MSGTVAAILPNRRYRQCIAFLLAGSWQSEFGSHVHSHTTHGVVSRSQTRHTHNLVVNEQWLTGYRHRLGPSTRSVRIAFPEAAPNRMQTMRYAAKSCNNLFFDGYRIQVSANDSVHLSDVDFFLRKKGVDAQADT